MFRRSLHSDFAAARRLEDWSAGDHCDHHYHDLVVRHSSSPPNLGGFCLYALRRLSTCAAGPAAQSADFVPPSLRPTANLLAYDGRFYHYEVSERPTCAGLHASGSHVASVVICDCASAATVFRRSTLAASCHVSRALRGYYSQPVDDADYQLGLRSLDSTDPQQQPTDDVKNISAMISDENQEN